MKVKWVRVPVMTNKKCRQTDYGETHGEESITDDMICAGYPGKGVKDACQGDSGGPLVCQGKDGGAVITGVVSFGDKCGAKNHPGVYARVTHFLKWIKDNMVIKTSFIIILTMLLIYSMNNEQFIDERLFSNNICTYFF